MNTQQSVLTTDFVSRVDGEVGCICPHCNRPAFLSASQFGEVRGEQFKHSDVINLKTLARCNGVFEVSTTARYDGTLFSSTAPEH